MASSSRRLALISVSDKTGLLGFAEALVAHGYGLVSTGGTHKALAAAGIGVLPIERLTGFPEMMDGRVKTLHPKVHGGILALRDDPQHVASMTEHGIERIDLVCVNLYPFEATVANAQTTEPEAIEQIDIGGPSMVRSAAKNFAHVAIVTDPSQYDEVAADLDANRGETSRELRRRLAVAAFERTSSYDAAIHAYLANADSEAGFPAVLHERYTLQSQLRYGENPHQRAAVYRRGNASEPIDLVGARQLAGKELSYNNLNDAAAAVAVTWDLSKAFPGRVGASVVKHTNPCGVAVAPSAQQAVELAFAGDPLAAYGGILSLGGSMDAETAQWLCEHASFFEVIVAMGFGAGAAVLLSERWKQVRLLDAAQMNQSGGGAQRVRSIPGGVLVQSPDDALPDTSRWQHTAGPEPTEDVLEQAALVWLASKHLTSNAIAIGGFDEALGGARLFGGGAGQMDRVASCDLAIRKAGDLSRIRTPIAASDAFFPFADGPEKLVEAGVRVLVHPGGSKRDQDTIDLCTAHGVTCLATGVRHFRH
jgi:phosphoribosylaminoimidazolecarboxamide formyltransferase / IMP cyclohydrolase